MIFPLPRSPALPLARSPAPSLSHSPAPPLTRSLDLPLSLPYSIQSLQRRRAFGHQRPVLSGDCRLGVSQRLSGVDDPGFAIEVLISDRFQKIDALFDGG